MSELPDWMVPPRPQGFFAEDLDHLPDAPKHTELWDGALVFMMSPQREWHHRVIRALEYELDKQVPPGSRVFSEMTVRLDDRTRPEPDILVTTAPPDDDRTFFLAEQVTLAVEVVSPESEHRDRHVKPERYARAGITSFWRVERDETDGRPVIHAYELDETTRTYVATQVARDTLQVRVPFPIEIDLADLLS